MPDDIRAELVRRDLLGAYQQRLAQMLSELNSGNAYRNMPYRAKTS
jgi:hypothetical protein